MTHTYTEKVLWGEKIPVKIPEQAGFSEAQTHADDIDHDPHSMRNVLKSIAQISDTASVIRMTGAMIVIAAMSAFLMQGWNGGSDNSRFYLLLSQTGLLAVAGFGLTYLLRETKGARVFFGLSILSITSNITTLGALIFSKFQWTGELVHYPTYAHWKVASTADLAMAFGAGLLVMVPIAYFGFMVLARKSAPVLLALFAVTNLLILVPVRESGPVALLAMVALFTPLFYLPKLLKEDMSLRTQEGYFAIATLFVPAAIMLVRSAWLYDMDAFFALTLAVAGYVVVRTHASSFRMKDASKQAGLLNFVLAAIIARASVLLIDPSFEAGQILFGYLFFVMGLDIANHSQQHRKTFVGIASMVLIATHAMPFFTLVSPVASLVYITLGGILIVTAKQYRYAPLLPIGAVVITAGVVRQLYSIVQVIDFTNWLTLAILGTTTIIAASVLERHGPVLKIKWQQLTQKIEL